MGVAPLQWQEQRRFSKESVRNQTLGQLVAKWFDGVVVPVKGAISAATEDGTDVPADVMAFKTSFSWQVDSDRFDVIKAGIGLMVRERNELVLHFVERFDVRTLPGCEQALAHLQELYARLEQQHVQPKDCAMQMNEAREGMAECMRRPAWKKLNFFTDPEKQPHEWLLLLAHLNGVADEAGWVQLDSVLTTLNGQPMQCSPKQLGRKTWYQVLKLLSGFEAARRHDAQGRQKVWFRFNLPTAETVPSALQLLDDPSA